MPRCVLSLAICFTLSGCKSSPAQPPPASAVSCSSDAECATNFRCDAQQRRCVCTSDLACSGSSAAPYCNAFTGLCVASVPGCTSDASCGPGNYCDTATRSCKTVTGFCAPCNKDAQCGAGSRCAAHPRYPQAGTFCVPACVTSGGGAPGCANGLSCLSRDQSPGADQLCYPATGACGVSNACTPDSLALCNADADCTDPGQSCDASLKACVSRTRNCPAGDGCDPQSRLCVHACTSDSDCTAIESNPGYQCRNNACFRRTLCQGDSDCTNGQNCQSNPDGSKSCVLGCLGATDCPLGQGCEKSVPAHPRCAAGCTQDSDCPLNNICASGACVGHTSNCAQSCQATLACPIGATCTAGCCTGGDASFFSNACGTKGSVCSACQTGPDCVPDCSTNCFTLVLANCNGVSDCQAAGYPDNVICSSKGKCEVLAHLQPCASDTDCTAKGFRCLDRHGSFGCGDGGGVCFPFQAAAEASCGRGQ